LYFLKKNATLHLCLAGRSLATIAHVLHADHADVDADGNEEIVVMLAAPEHRPPRLHVYALTAAGLTPRWRGRSMSGELEAFGLIPSATEDEAPLLATLERSGAGRQLLIYCWESFGFAGRCAAALPTPPEQDTVETTGLLCGRDWLECRHHPGFPALACHRSPPRPATPDGSTENQPQLPTKGRNVRVEE